jgi:hypothetical protein
VGPGSEASNWKKATVSGHRGQSLFFDPLPCALVLCRVRALLLLRRLRSEVRWAPSSQDGLTLSSAERLKGARSIPSGQSYRNLIGGLFTWIVARPLDMPTIASQ